MKSIITFIKLFTILSFLIFQTENSFAQNKVPPEHYFGIKGGAIYSTLNLDVNTDGDMVINNGITGGIVYRYFTQQQVGLQLELNYTEKGGRNFFEKNKLTDTIGIEGNTYFNLNLKYIELPFMMHMRIGKGGNRLKFNLGSHLAYNIYQNIIFKKTILETGYKEQIDYKFEYGFIFGIGYGRTIPGGIIDLEIRYSLGLTNIYEVRSINSSMKNQNQTVMITLSYLYRVNKNKKSTINK